MCWWLTLAARNRDVLAPLRELGAQIAAADHPELPEVGPDAPRWLVTRGGCSCGLLARPKWHELATALARLPGRVLVHVTFGDPPDGKRALEPPEGPTDAELSAEPRRFEDRWLEIVPAYRPGVPPPPEIDG